MTNTAGSISTAAGSNQREQVSDACAVKQQTISLDMFGINGWETVLCSELLRCNNPLANFWKIAEYCESGPAPCRLVVRVTAEKTGELMARSKEKN